MNQTPHKHTHKLMINHCPLPPVFLLAVLYANPNRRDGCLSQTTMVMLYVCVCVWRLESETHYGGPSLGYFNANSNSGTSHTLGSGILEVILNIKGPQHGK